MYKITSVFILVLLFSYQCTAQVESEVKKITKKYESIQKKYSAYDTTIVEMKDRECGEGQGIGYFKKGKLQLIRCLFFSDNGKNEWEYYFEDDTLFYASTKEFIYNRPIGYDEKKRIEADDYEAFDSTKSTIYSYDYFYNKEKFIYCLENGYPLDLTIDANYNEGDIMFDRVRSLKERFNKDE